MGYFGMGVRASILRPTQSYAWPLKCNFNLSFSVLENEFSVLENENQDR